MKTLLASTAALLIGTGVAFAQSDSAGQSQDQGQGESQSQSMSSGGQEGSSGEPSITASDQDVSNGIVSAETVNANDNGWMVVHRTDSEMAPGPVVGYAPIRGGTTNDVAAILTEDVASGDMLMLMVHSEDGGNETGVFEYTLGASEDGPIRVNDELVTSVITAQ